MTGMEISLVLIVNQFSGHVDDDKKRCAQLEDASKAMSQDIQRLERGAQGLRGEPPAGWTVAEADGSLTTCERVEGFDPAVPRY